MKRPVAPESTKAQTPYFRWVSVLSTSTCRYRECRPISAALILGCLRRRFSHFDCFGGLSQVASTTVGGMELLSETSSMGNT